MQVTLRLKPHNTDTTGIDSSVRVTMSVQKKRDYTAPTRNTNFPMSMLIPFVWESPSLATTSNISLLFRPISFHQRASFFSSCGYIIRGH